MSTQQDLCTKTRLLAAAREHFALRGVKEATVREICAQAGANVAAVNYHFGGKDKLFIAVLLDFMEKAQAKYPVHMGLGPEAPPEERLKAYIRSLLYRLMGDGDPVNEKLGQLLSGEFIEPSADFGVVMERYITPQHEVLLGIIRELLPEADGRTVHLCAAGVVGHCVLFDNAKQLIRQVYPELDLEKLGVELVADFVQRYALAGIARMREAN
ncbi:MAG TPA: CerR family C-terminal domain-containing protein [Humidesulfovibrio sp.]|uniref:CerR family C-terminal domain-containing protein n=1 Tax=Humidesulfovibrio sp. TaxID=2910988 RepID=UPI002B842E9B|nr:CerR family C-terminal domain-containing protein [Humidesulfovibrio sp.]HWR04614.1 CerR family C-terminal domain-containing protein [Humidesulfovibrio sp.]